ncbi:hypothetical protein FGRMN_5808 [Fusarium graminum]|nr:hypothetical protein FGRMN_5808 [Fusarium graminum]
MAQPQPDPMEHLAPMGPLPPLVSNTDPNRVLARDQPPNLREAFNDFYPNGLPHVYRMLQTPGAKGVPQTYLENYLPVGFYKNPKIEAGAAFSTQNGLRPFRYVEHLLSQRRIHLWSKDEIQSVCNSLRKSYWENMKSMQKPHCWDSLWSYFDACDIYNYGALNLWNVINQLFDENQVIYMDVAKEKAIETSRWADEWLRVEDNDKKLLQWDETKGPVLRVLTDEDWITLGTIDDAELVLFVTNALKCRRSLLLSPEKLRPDAKPNHLMTSCSNKNLENWLAGQRIFEPSGLPPPPKVESHHGSPTSKKTPAPCTMQNGEHYFQSPGQQATSAIEVLQQSAAAAGPVAPESGQAVSAGQIDKFNTTTWNTLREPPEARSKSTEPSASFNANELCPSNGRMDKSLGLSGVHGSSTQTGSHDEDELDADTPTKIRKRGHGNPRATGGQKSTVTASLPGSAVMRYSAPILVSASAQAGNDAQQANQATSSPPKENQSRQSDKIRGVETQASVIKELQKNQQPNRILARSVFHDQTCAQYPDNTNTINRLQRPYSEFHTNAVAKGFPEEAILLTSSEMYAPLGITLHEPGHHPGTFNHSIQGAYSIPQPSFGTSTGLGNRHPNVQQPSISQKDLISNRGRTNSNGSRFERFEPSDTRWPQQNQENFSGANPGFGRGSYQRGAARRGRRGGHNSRNATAPVMQPHPGSDLVHKKRDGTPWREQWRRGGSNLIQVTCENVQNGLTINDYVPCSCQMCEARNRSVYITAEACQDIPQADMLSRIKFGLGERYGFVEEVYPLPSKEPGRFIARFADSCSVGEALTMGGGNMPEHGISVAFSPALRSKWTLSAQAPTRAVSGQSVDQHSSIAHFSPYPFGLSMANNSITSSTTPMPPRIIYPPMTNAAQTHNAQIWSKNGGQRAFSGFFQPQTFGHTSTARYPMSDFQQFVPGKPILDSTQVRAPATTQLEKCDTFVDEPLQTKPPAEEALDDIRHTSQGISDSPRSDGSKSTGLKARVSLPNTPSKTSHSRNETSTTKADYQVPIGKAHLGRNSTINLDGNLESGRRNMTEADTVPRPQAMLPSETTSNYTHSRVPSAFTEHEIKERRQAWAKISMPLYPRRPNSSTPTKPGSDNTKDVHLGVVKADKHVTTAIESDRSTTPTQNVTFTPDTGSVHEPSPDKPRDTMSFERSQSLPSVTHSVDSGEERESVLEERESVLEEPRQHRVQAIQNTAEFSASANESLTYQDEHSNEVHAPNSNEQTVPLQESCPPSRPESPSGTQTKGRPTKTKKSKKKKAKQNVLSQSNAMDHSTHQQTSSVPRSDHMISQNLKVSAGENSPGPMPGSHFGSQESGASTPIKRHHEEVEQRSVFGSFKRSKKHESIRETIPGPSQLQQNSLDESDSPDGSVRGRKGFRIGRGGSLRMTKQRRPRAIMPGSVIAEQHREVQKSPPSSDFAFQCQSHPALAGSPGVRGAENMAISRLNPQAQEFVSPSRPADFIKHLNIEHSDTETPGRYTLGDSAPRASGLVGDNLKPFNIGLPNTKSPLHDDSVSSTMTDLTPKHRRARSEVIQKDTPKKGKGQASQAETKKTPAKNSKRGKGKERAVTVSVKPEKVENNRAMIPGTPRTPKQQDTKAKNPGLINDDWPTLPASRDRAQSKPQTPSIWGTKTQNNGEDHSGKGSPSTKG